MSVVRSFIGAVVGGAVVAVGARAYQVAHAEGRSIRDIAPRLPSIFADDMRLVVSSAREAVGDGRVAAARTRDEIGEELTTPRRTGSLDV